MRYLDLFNELKKLTKEQLEDDVTVFDHSIGEYFPAVGIDFAVEGELHDGHVVIEFNR